MADSENQQPLDTTQQVTSQTPTTTPKNPKQVAAGKAVDESTKLAREAQKKALAEAQIFLVNQKKGDPLVAAPVAVESEGTRNVLTTTQWLSVISICVSLWGIYHEREEITALFTKRPPRNPPHHHLLMSLLNLSMSRLKKKGGIRSMD